MCDTDFLSKYLDSSLRLARFRAVKEPITIARAMHASNHKNPKQCCHQAEISARRECDTEFVC